MLQKSKSRKAMLLKYGIVIPAILISVSLFSNKIYAQTETNEKTTSKEKNEISFSEVDVVPRFTECKNAVKEDAMKCFNDKMMEHIKTNFTYPKEAAKKNIQGQVSIQFIIDKEGNIRDIITRGPENGELLEVEAKRIVSLLPKFIPAKHNGKTVNIKYGLPITFKLK